MISSQALSGCATAGLASIGSPAEHRLFLPPPAPLSLVLPEDRQRMTPGLRCAPKKHSGVKARLEHLDGRFTRPSPHVRERRESINAPPTPSARPHTRNTS